MFTVYNWQLLTANFTINKGKQRKADVALIALADA
jgi:hypothetical protein